jgi:hypothetical protein
MAIKKEIEINVKTDSAVKNVNNLNKEIKKTNEESKKTGEGVKDLANLSDGATGGMISKFGSLTGTLGKVSVAFRSVGAAIAASGIGLLVIVIASVISAFKSSEEGQNKFAKLMGVIGSVVGNVMDVISDLGEIIIGVLSGDSKAIKSATDFGKKIFDVVGLPIKNIIDIVKTAGAVLGSLFSGDVEGALNALDNGIKNVKGNFNEATGAIKGASNSLKEFGKEALREAKIAQDIADNRAKADKTERNLIVQRAEGDRKIAELREKAVQRDTYNVSQRIAMLKEAQAIETNLTNQEIAAAKLRADAKTKENALSKSTKEDLLEEENLKAKVIQLETSRLQGNRRLVSSIQSLQAEVRAEEKAAVEEKKKELEAEKKLKEEKIEKDIQDEKKRNDAIEALRKSYAQKIEDLEDTTELQKIERQQQRALLELEALNASEEQKLELLQYYSALKLNAQKTDNEKADAESKAKTEKEIADAKAVADAKLAIQNSVLDSVASGIGVLKQLGEKNKAIQKAALIAENAVGIAKIIINTKAANAAAVATSPLTAGQPWVTINTIGAALGVAGSLLATKKALSALGGGGAPSGGSELRGGSSGGASAPAPQFNVVGNTGINQLAQTLGTQQPIEAFVVASNVTSAQSINRNIVQNASLG